MEFFESKLAQMTETIQLQNTDSLQASDALTSNKPVAPISQPSLSYTALIGHAKDWGPCSQWGDEQWNAFKEYIEKESPSGEETMKMLDYKRRDKIENLFYKLSNREKKLCSIHWENDYSKGERSLPALKIGKEGLRISYKQFEKIGIHLTSDTSCEMKKKADDEVIIKFYPNRQ